MGIYYAIDIKSGTWDFVYSDHMVETMLDSGMIVNEIPDELIGKPWVTINKAMAGVVTRFQDMLENNTGYISL